jgi:predicted O-methyltransferase YrrM
LAAAAAVDAGRLSPEQRYAWGERVFAAFVPDVRLSEFGRSFFHDAEFIADYERFDRQNYRSLDRKFALKELLPLALRRPGEVAECGVFRGASAFLIARALRRNGGGRRLHLFDSFAGLSAPEAADGGYWAAGILACRREDAAANLAEFADLVAFHEGWIPERFTEVGDSRFCFVHLDVDLLQPTRAALEFFYPRMVAGGLILCDDYGFETCPGARQAMDAFFADRPEPVVHLPTGQGLVLIEPREATGPEPSKA